LSDYHKGKNYKQGVKSVCKECAKEANAKRYVENKDHILEVCKRWAEANPEKRKIISRSYKARNRKKAYESTRDWLLRHPEKLRGYQAKRRAQKIQAAPPWLTKDQLDAMSDLYKTSKVMEEKFGLKYHVDHIVPLNGEDICGLHVPWNLQVLEAGLNISKSNQSNWGLQKMVDSVNPKTLTFG
jgi:hypothetical protein